MKFLIEPAAPLVIDEGLTGVMKNGALLLEVSGEYEVSGKDESLKMYRKMLTKVYGPDAPDQLRGGMASYRVDRVRQALYWDIEGGGRLFIFPRKGQEGRITSLQTWLE